jgi:pyroglutamyl-peptidase
VKPIVVAAFEPFGGRRHNRSDRATAWLRGATIAGRPVELERLPTVFAALPARIDELLARGPELLLLVGESAAARRLQVERVALNLAHARLGDNAGARPIDAEIEPGGELARRVAFDARVAANAAVAAGVPCDVSSHAGTFCCNAALYHALGRTAQPGAPLVGFVHVPAHWPWAQDRRAARGLYAIAAALVAVDRR